MKVPSMVLEPVIALKSAVPVPKIFVVVISPVMIMLPALALPMVVDVAVMMVWKPGEPHVKTAGGLSDVMLPVVRMLDILV